MKQTPSLPVPRPANDATREKQIPFRHTWKWLAAALAVAAVLLSLRGLGHGFLLLDDIAFIRDHPRVSQGWSPENAVWALTSRDDRNWMPLARWIYLMNTSWFGGWAGGHHLVSALLHGLAVWLCVWSWRLWSQSAAAALTAGAVFALHPLQVEAVAWITAQKDLLSAVFVFLALGCWKRSLAPGKCGQWLWIAYFAFAGALMAKPAVLGLPVFLLLAACTEQTADPRQRRFPVASIWRLMPLVLMAAVAAVLTIWAARSSAGADTPERQPLISLVHAPVGMVKYLGTFFWPTGLCSQHPLPRTAPVAGGLLALSCLTALTLAAWRLRRRQPWIWLGWSWALIMLLPSSGLVAFGPQGWAERFGYVAISGLGISLAGWFRAARLPLFHAGVKLRRQGMLTAAGVICCGMALLFWKQQAFWRDSETLFRRTIEVEGEDGSALLKLGTAFADQGLANEAAGCWAQAYGKDPGFLPTRYNHACALMAQRNFPAALLAVEPVVIGHPHWAEAHLVLANALVENGRAAEAVIHYETAAALKPGLPTAARNAAILRQRIFGARREAGR